MKLIITKTRFKAIRVLFACMLLYSNTIFSQHVSQGVKLSQYVFDEFYTGTVKMKGGETYDQLLNYNIVTGEMIFNTAGKYLAIAAPENVDTVYINNRKFIPLNNKFYEVLLNVNAPLLLEFTYTVTEPGTSTGYGGTTSTTAASSFKSLVSSGAAYDLKLPDGFTVTPGYTYWILKDSKLEKAGTIKQLSKIFPDKKDNINEYVKKNNPNLSKQEDIISLVKQIE